MSDNNEMYVFKRDGQKEVVSFDKILQRIKNTGHEAGITLNYTTIAMKVIDQLYDGITTTQIDELTADQCASLASTHPDYNTLAGRIVVSNHQKNTSSSFVEVMTRLYEYRDKHDKPSPLVSNELIQIVNQYSQELDEMCDYSRDYLIDFFGFKTLDRAYMIKINRITVERPQHMWLRVAIGIHYKTPGLDRIRETYNAMSQKYFTHATPTLFNAGTPHPQLSSCFLLQLEQDSIDGIYNTLKDCANISKWAGGIGLHIHNLRAKGSHIRGTNGLSNGIVPMLRVFNNTAKYVDQCLHPDTILHTTDGPIRISDSIAGKTRVLNRSDSDWESSSESKISESGFYNMANQMVNTLYPDDEQPVTEERVKRVLEHAYEGPILQIRTHLVGTPLQITPEHPVYAMEKYADSPEWIDAGALVEGDYLVYPIPKYIKNYSELTDDICLMYGLILQGLYLFKNRSEEDSKYMYVRLAYDDFNQLRSLFDLEHIEYEIVDETASILRWRQTVNLPFSRSDFYNSRGELEIGSRWSFLPIAKTECILNGLYTIFPSQAVKNTLAESILFQYLRIGRLEECVHANLRDTILRINNDYMVPITSILEEEYDGILYDLQMVKNHNYQVGGGALVHNGGGKRNGSFAIYLEPWHADIEQFLQMRKNHGDEELKARDLFYALWIPDLFMERVKADGEWTLMCPDECPGLADVYGADFVALYTQYEREGKGRATLKARQLWFQVLDAQMETGTPYLLYKDAANNKSNQKNIGTIKSSNLCSEIIQYSDENESAVCNLASIALPVYVLPNGNGFDFAKLHEIAKMVTYNLNQVIDVNYYPTTKTKHSNLRHRPIGIGIQGLADVFMMMGYPFDSDAARTLNRHIFETIYHAALEQSCDLAEMDGAYETFAGSPASKGELQFDMWSVVPDSGRYDWDALKTRIQKHGLRNSLLLAPMPTASTSQILGYNECIEPITSNIYSRRTLAGEFIMANRYLMKDLIDLGMWNEKIKNNIIANHGSIQQLDGIPPEIRAKYRTVWEIPMRSLIDMAADRGAYVCQSQSLNLWLEDPTYSTLTSMHFYACTKGLKTGIYYLRRRGRHQAQQFTIEPEQVANYQEEEHEICEMCSA